MKITGNAHIEPFNKNISGYQGCARLEDFKDVLTAGANFARLKHRMMALKVMKMIPPLELIVPFIIIMLMRL